MKFNKFLPVTRTRLTRRRGSGMLVLAYLWTLFSLVRTQSGGINLNPVCERTLSDGTVEYLACSAGSEDLSLLDLSVSVDPVNSTCGLSSDVNRLIYSTLDYNVFVCDASNASLAHPPEYIIDGDDRDSPTWWQSTSWYDFPQPLEINVTVSLDHSYTLVDSIEIIFQSARPQQMILEKSNDRGATWETLQYYSRDCLEDFSLDDTRESDIKDVSQVICTSEYSGILPYRNAPVKFDVEERLALLFSDGVSPALQVEAYQNDTEFRDLLTLTDLRLRLLRPATDGLEYPGYFFSLSKYYYAISNIQSFLTCNCNQHGRFCAPSPESGDVVCECFHNTMGTNCEQCLPLYNDRPWKAGSFTPFPTGTPNECQKCTCNDHAASCIYNATLGYGVCQDCYDNTAGDFCDICVDGFFRNESRDRSDPDVCIECNCEQLGTVDNNTVCAQFADDATGSPIGQCPCKGNVTGRACDQCVDSFYGLLTEPDPGRCRECGCNVLGTLNATESCDQTSGQCFCKANTDTRTCGMCKDQFYGYPTDANEDCSPCDCDPGGAISLTCNKVTGRCDCRGFTGGRTCTNVESGYYFPYLDVNSHDAWEANSSCVHRSDFPSDGFSGLGYLECGVGDRILFNGIRVYSNVTERISSYLVLRYTYVSQSPWLMAALRIIVEATEDTALSCPYPAGDVIASPAFSLQPGEGVAWSSEEPYGFHQGCSYSAAFELDSAGLGANAIVIDALVLIPDPSSSTVYRIGDPVERGFYEDCLRDISAYSNRSRALEACRPFTYSLMMEIVGEAQKCSCNVEGSLPQTVCSTYGGSCLCKPGVGGQNCDRCLPGFFNFTSSGCQACNCDQNGSITQACDFITGQCPCKSGVASEGQTSHLGLASDRRCSACQENFFGFGNPDGCGACGCHPLGSLDLQCSEDGVCRCLETVGGEKCDSCLQSFYNLTSEGCSACDCNMAGSLTSECNSITGVCSCKTNVEGSKCDGCRPGFFNLDDANPEGCQPCFCYGHGTSCNAAPNYVLDFVRSDFTQGSTNGWRLSDPSSLNINPTNIRVSHPPSLPSGASVYLIAPEEYLGFKLSSYGGSFRFTSKIEVGSADQSSNRYLVLTGGPQNTSIFYAAEEFVPTDQPSEFTATFYEGMWRTTETGSEVTVLQFQEILADVTSIQVRASFGPGTVSTFFDVSMETASSVSSSEDANNEFVTTVEQCVCDTSSNTMGLSCSSCSSGTKRLTPFGPKTDICVPCFCNGRSSACDPDSGVCMGCRSGTVGDLCESCADNVQEPNCDQCIPDYYGFGTDLFGGACSACGCNTTGTGGATQCDNDSGQCPCVGNFGEQRCDGCAYNYYNYDSGCLKCDVCYDGIETTHLRLLALQRNLSQFVSDLEERDNSSIPEPFYQRLQETNDLLADLVDATSSTIQEGSNLQSTIAALISVMEALISTLDGAVQNDIMFAQGNASAAQENAQLALEAIGVVNVDLTVAYETLTSGDFQAAQTILEGLRDDLMRQAVSLEEVRQQTANQTAALEQDVARIRELTQETIQAADELLETAQTAQVIHDNTTSRTATEVTHANSVATLAEETLDDAEELLGSAQDLDDSAKQKVADVEAARTSVDDDRIDLLMTDASVKTGQAVSLTVQADSKLSDAQNTITTVEEARITTENTQLEVDATVAEVMDRYDRAAEANRDSSDSVMLSQDTFNAAEEMLVVSLNFDAQSNVAQSEAFTAVEQIPEINRIANENLAESGQLRAQVSGVGSTASEGSRVAAEAFTVVNNEGQTVLPIHERAEQLYTEAANQLTDTDQITESLNQLDQDQIQPSLQACDVFQPDIDDLEASYDQVSAKADESAVSTSANQGRLEALLQEVANIEQVDTSQLPALQERLRESGELFSMRDYAAIVAALQQGLAQQGAWLEDTRTVISELQAQIDALESFNVNP
ncbi:laminin subunit gamma-2-like [Lytechinus variegatus]|uniref:laminin subunit gamma-2-like n=1 Tax=Lytechinus variegatus TaxID=7654 RepID=UPI001BB1FB48|nr:laminin subunit gamma-2-like [Lytechinus variegatus]